MKIVVRKNEAPRTDPSTLLRMVRRNGECSRTKVRGFLERNTERRFFTRTFKGVVFWPRMYKFQQVRSSLAGFTLIEIMVVIAIVMILAGLAIPQILRSRVIGNEVAAIANLKTLSNACQLYSIDNKVYPEALTDLSDANPRYADLVLTSGIKQGYRFEYNLVNADHFTINASSENSGLLRGRYFYTDESGVIRFNVNSQAGPKDEMVQ